MQLRKKITETNLATAEYTADGIALRLTKNGDKFMNSVAILENINGEIRLTLFDEAIERYGVKIAHIKSAPKEW